MRLARLDDLPRLLTLETLCFERDRFSARTFRYLLTKGHALCAVFEVNTVVQGASMVLFRKGSSRARLYHFANAP